MPAADCGRMAEDTACDYLLARGLILLERNFRSRQGEIDLILLDADTLVFVEVRYRRQPGFGSAAESVDPHKQIRLSACASYYLQTQPDSAPAGCRFDVVAIDGPERTIEWIKDAFSVTD